MAILSGGLGRSTATVSLCIGRLGVAVKLGLFVVVLTVLAATACGDGISHFVFRYTGSLGEIRSFIAATTDPNVIARSREELERPAKERTLYIQGPVAEGDGGLNEGWNWHFTPSEWKLVDSSLEICNAEPEFLDATLQDWVEKIGRYCPRSARLAEER